MPRPRQQRRRRQRSPDQAPKREWGFGGAGQPEWLWNFANQPPQPPPDPSVLPWQAFLQASCAALKQRDAILAGKADDLEPPAPTIIQETLPLLLLIGAFNGCPARPARRHSLLRSPGLYFISGRKI